MRHLRTTILLALCASLLISISSAQPTSTLATTTSTSVPNLIRYSGTLKDAQGAPVSSGTAVGVTFAIYNQQDGGAAVWQEIQNVTPDAGGNYSVLLGSTTATGLPNDLFSQQEQRWLSVQVQGLEEPARSLLVSVPYAFKAHEAETLGGLSASAFVKAGPASGSGASAPGSAAENPGAAGNSGGTSKAAGVGAGTVVNCANSATGRIPVFTQSAPPNIIVCNSGIYEAPPYGTGPIGILNPNPVAALDVTGATNTSLYYQILENTVLAIPGYASGTEDLAVGAQAGGTFSRRSGLPSLSGTNDTFLGILAGNATTSGSYDTFLGDEAGIFNTTGSQNTYTGYTAGYGNTSGNLNSCYGSGACLHNLTGNENVAVGVNAGFRNTTGSANTYVGFDVNFGNTIQNLGSNNTMVGFEAGFANTASNGSFFGYTAGYNNTANGNSFFGYAAGTANTTGNSDTFLGNLAGTANTTGSGNTFVGDSAGLANVTNNYNTFTGQNAGKANTVDGNNFNGYNSGTANTTGAANTFFGYLTGSTNTVGGGNTFVGFKAGLNSYDPAAGNCCNTYVGNGAGAGVNGPSLAAGNSFFGHRAGEATTTGGKNTFSGYWSGLVNQTGSFNSFYGDQSGQSLTAGNYNTFLGISTAGSFTSGNYNTFVGAFAGNSSDTGNNNIYVGNVGASESNTIRIGGDTGSGYGAQTATFIAGIYNSTATPSGAFQSVCVDVNGTVFGVSVLTNCITSSRRFKEQIADMGDSSSKLLQLRPVNFFYKPEYDDGSHQLQYGLIAEEVAKVYPEMVAYGKDGQPYTVKYQLLAPMLLNELQKEHAVVMSQQDELQTQLQQIKAQRQEIDGLKHELQLQNASLQVRLSKLESYVATQTQMKTASNVQPATAASPSGDSQ